MSDLTTPDVPVIVPATEPEHPVVSAELSHEERQTLHLAQIADDLHFIREAVVGLVTEAGPLFEQVGGMLGGADGKPVNPMSLIMGGLLRGGR